MNRRRVVAAVVSLTMAIAAAAAIAVTTAAWTDENHFEATATAGTWTTSTTVPPDLPAITCGPAPGEPPEATCDANVTDWNVWGSPADKYQVKLHITSSWPSSFRWQVRLDLDRFDFPSPGPTPGSLFISRPWGDLFSGWNVCADSSSAPPIVLLRGTSWPFTGAGETQNEDVVFESGTDGSPLGGPQQGAPPYIPFCDGVPPTTPTTTTTTSTSTTTTTTLPPDPLTMVCYRAGQPSAQDCSLTNVQVNLFGPGGMSGYRLQFDVTSSASPPFVWEALFDLRQPPFPGVPVPAGGWTPALFNNVSNLCFMSGSGDLPLVRVRGTGEQAQIGNGTTISGLGFNVEPTGPPALPSESFAC